MTYEYSRIRIQDWGQGTFSGTIVKYEEIDWKGKGQNLCKGLDFTKLRLSEQKLFLVDV